MEIKVTFDGKKKVVANLRNHVVVTDQPVGGGGDDSAVTPYELFLASLVTCSGIFVKGFCDNRGISADGITLTQRHSFDEKGFATGIDIVINLPKDFPEKYIDSVVHVANLCKVKQQLGNPPQMTVTAHVNE